MPGTRSQWVSGLFPRSQVPSLGTAGVAGIYCTMQGFWSIGNLIESRTVSNYKVPCSYFIPVCSQAHSQTCIPEFSICSPQTVNEQQGNQARSNFLKLHHWTSSLLFLLPTSVCSPMSPPWFLHKGCCPSESTLSSLASPKAPLPQCHDQTVCEYLQAWRLQNVPGQPVLVASGWSPSHCVKVFLSDVQ